LGDLTPSATQRFVNFNDAKQLVTASLSQAKLGVEQFAIGIEGFEQIRNSLSVA
jgi:hypothetical protein